MLHQIHKNTITPLILCGVLFSGITGCSKSGTESSEAPATQTASTGESQGTSNGKVENASPVSTKESKPKTNEAFDVTGVWYGKSTLDVDAANKKLANLPYPEAQRLLSMINTFQSIEMAASFNKDHALEIDMMITNADGQQFRDRSLGRWEIVESGDDLVKIKTQEYSSDKNETKEKLYLYRFLGKDRFQFVPESVNPELYIFSPRIVFDRLEVDPESTNIAEETKGTEVR